MDGYHYIANTTDNDHTEGWIISAPHPNPMQLVKSIYPGISAWKELHTHTGIGYSPTGALVHITVEHDDNITLY